MKKGEILSLLGENGSGKTTLMNMISGIYFPDEGHIFVDGKEVSIRSPKDSFDLGIGMIHQHFKLIDVMTLSLIHILEKEMNEKAMELLKVFELDGKADFLASNLPYGEQRKLEIARALATNPKLLL